MANKTSSTGGLYAMRNKKLIGMSEQPFLREKVLQQLLAEYPDLLAQIADDQSTALRGFALYHSAELMDADTDPGTASTVATTAVAVSTAITSEAARAWRARSTSPEPSARAIIATQAKPTATSTDWERKWNWVA